jgi:hypothetical protein
MQDPESLYELAKLRIAELRASADRHRDLPSIGKALYVARAAILSAWSGLTKSKAHRGSQNSAD